MEKKLKKIMAELLEKKEEEITTDSSINNVETWDSLTQLRLISAIEEAFNVVFEGDEMLQLTSYENIVACLKKKIGNHGN